MSVRCTWLGQASLLLDFDGVTVMVNPYLSVSEKEPALIRSRIRNELAEHGIFNATLELETPGDFSFLPAVPAGSGW